VQVEVGLHAQASITYGMGTATVQPDPWLSFVEASTHFVDAENHGTPAYLKWLKSVASTSQYQEVESVRGEIGLT
jgi:hypothetical protein